MKVKLNQIELQLLPERAVYLPVFNSLILSDVHLGKSATFRQHGIPVPEGETLSDLNRITALLESTTAARLIIVGDLFHSAQSVSVYPQFFQWLEACSAEVTLIAGNHDQHFLRFIEDRMEETNLNVRPHLTLSAEAQTLHFVHDPAHVEEVLTQNQKVTKTNLRVSEPLCEASSLTICGHLHPTISIKETSRTKLRLPCFLHTQNQLILPAFGSFTRGRDIKKSPEDQVFLTIKSKVIAFSELKLK